MKHLIMHAVAAILVAGLAGPLAAQTDTTFTYQGELKDGGSLANGSFAMDFSVWDAAGGGTQIGSTQSFGAVTVTDGRFTVELDFGASSLPGGQQWLQIDVNATPLSPRQPITRAPYSIQTRGLHVNAALNVGIGTSSPAWPLDVAGAQAVGKFTSTSATFGSVIELRNSTPGASHLGAFNFVNDLGQFQGQLAYTGDDQMTFRVNGVERARIDSSGRLGVGIVTPGAKVDVLAQGETAISGLCDFGSTGVRGWATASSGTTYGVHGRGDSSSGIGVYGEATSITGLARGVVGESASSQGMALYGSASASGGATYGCYAEAASSSGAGVFGIASHTSGVNVGVGGRSNSFSGFDFYASGSGVDYGSSSSRRWKNNILNINDPLYKLSKLRGVSFDWDTDHGGHHDIGFIAEEVGEVLPEIVRYEENGVDAIGMDYSKMTPLLVEAVNALRSEKDAEIAALRADSISLRSENEAMRERLLRMEQQVALMMQAISTRERR